MANNARVKQFETLIVCPSCSLAMTIINPKPDMPRAMPIRCDTPTCGERGIVWLYDRLTGEGWEAKDAKP